ncbi:MAG: metallophosphoesterase family protein [Gammaproteobacteria bacterium]|nr:metallophosphoesterase family protein [Gammaproteobacteria bacterium]
MLLNKETDFSHQSKIKIAILSDTHEELDDGICAITKECDLAIHAGDIGSSTVLNSIQTKTGHLIAVAGNNDKPYLWDFKDWQLVKSLPLIKEILVPGGKIVIEHGHMHDMHKPAHSDLRAAHPQAKLIIYGHTHSQVIDHCESEPCVLNPGAAGYTRNKGGPSCIVLSIDNDDWDYEVFRFSDEVVE